MGGGLFGAWDTIGLSRSPESEGILQIHGKGRIWDGYHGIGIVGHCLPSPGVNEGLLSTN